MVLSIYGIWLVLAMAIVWAGSCGGMAVLLDYKIERRRALLICATAFTAIYVLSVLLSFILSQGWFDIWRPLSLVLPLAVFWFLSSDSPARLFFICFTQLNVCGFIIMTTGLTASQFAEPEPVLISMLLLMNSLMMWLYIKKLRAPLREIITTLEARWSITVFMPAAFTVSFMLLVGKSSDLSGLQLSLTYAAAFVIFGTMCLCYCEIYKNLKQSEALRRSLENAALLKAQLRRQREEMGMFESARQATSRIRHDIRHHASILLRFIDDNETGKARDYISKIIAESETKKVKRWCANYTLNTILSIYTERAEKRGIKVEAEASVPAELDLDEMELASIYANAIENAAEGCAAVPATAERWIKIYTACKDGRLMLMVDNSCAQGAVKFDEMGMPLSSKEEGGTGTRSIRYVVEKHGGTWFFNENDGVFSTKIVIPTASGSGQH